MKLTLLILSFLMSSTVFAKGTACDDYSKYKDIDMKEMTKIVKSSSATIIDVNSDKSFAKSHIPGSVHFNANKKNLAKVLPKDKDAMIVAYCGGKMCTAWQRAAEKACEMGYTNIKHFSEGITGWNKQSRG